LSRISRAGELTLGPGTRFAGMFRAHGLLVPVWDLPADAEAGAWEEPVAAFAQRYATARSAGTELDAEERRARAGLLGRQVALRPPSLPHPGRNGFPSFALAGASR